MLGIMLSHLSSLALLASNDEGTPVILLALGPAGAGAVYWGLWRYYRNTHQSHRFELETRIEAEPISGSDTKVSEITGTRSAGIDGDNRSDHRRRVQRVSSD